MRLAFPRSLRLAALGAGLVLAAGLAAPAARAQDPTPPTPVLPDLAPREVEIRGELEIAFPSLQRQPLVGFNPPPRVIEIADDRQPFVEDYKQATEDLPPSPLVRPEAPAVSPLAGQTPVAGEFSAGLGSYFSRFAQARGGLPLGGPSQPALYGRLEYTGTDGHTPVDSLSALRSSADLLQGVVGLSAAGGPTRGGVELDGFSQSYALHGARVGAPELFALPLDSLPDRTGRGVGLAAWIATGGPTTASFEGRVRFAGARYETDLFADTPLREGNDVVDALARTDQSERRLDADFRAELPMAARAVLLDLAAGSAGHDVAGDADGRAAYVDAGAGLRVVRAGRLTLTAGAHLLAFDASGTPASEERWGFLSPLVRIETFPTTRLRLYAENRPAVEPNALADVYRANPYVADEPRLQPTLRTVDAEAGLSFFSGPVQVAARAGYRRSPNELYFEERPASGPLPDRNLFAVAYGEAEILHAGGDLSVVLPAGFHATIGATVRRARLTEDDAALPYVAPFQGQAMLSYAFSGGRGLAQVVGQLEGARPRRAVADSLAGLPAADALGDADAFLDLDLRATYNLSEAVGVLARIDNVGGAERWTGYPAPPAVISAGLRIRW